MAAGSAARPRQRSSGRSTAMPDGFELLEHDHRTVEALFDEYEQNGDDQLADKICFELTVHGLIEETELYPRLRDFGERTEEMADQAETQHTLIKNYVGRVQALTGEERVPEMEELWATVDAHVREEETD